MRKLLGANFARLKKSKVFWLCMGFMFFFGLYRVWNQYRDKAEFSVSLNESLFNHAIMIGILCAVFVSLFVGTEYSDGTIRNKLVIGHSRTSVYLSNLITSIAAALLMVAAYTLPILALGIPLIGSLTAPAPLIAATALGCILMTATFCSLCMLLGMNCQTKATVAVITILASFVLLMAASLIAARLDAPEYYSNYVITEEGPSVTEEMPNPDYLRGTKRLVYETILDILPTGQGIQYASMQGAHLWQMPLYSAGIILISTGAGIAIFRKKDIK